jgi:hypothetical protein
MNRCLITIDEKFSIEVAAYEIKQYCNISLKRESVSSHDYDDRKLKSNLLVWDKLHE